MNTISSLLKFIAYFEPVGSIKMYAGSSAPDKWLICDGSAVSRTTYSKLYAAIGTTFGAGDGSTTFNLPNFSGRTAVGVGTGYTLGSTGGSKDAIVPYHTHSVTGGSHYHNNNTALLGYTGSGGAATSGTHYKWQNGQSFPTQYDGGHSHDCSYAGTSVTDANMQPYITVNHIIFAGE